MRYFAIEKRCNEKVLSNGVYLYIGLFKVMWNASTWIQVLDFHFFHRLIHGCNIYDTRYLKAIMFEPISYEVIAGVRISVCYRYDIIVFTVRNWNEYILPAFFHSKILKCVGNPSFVAKLMHFGWGIFFTIGLSGHLFLQFKNAFQTTCRTIIGIS